MLGIRVLLDIPGWGPAKWAVELLALRLVHHPQLNRVLIPTVALELAERDTIFTQVLLNMDVTLGFSKISLSTVADLGF